MPDTEIQETSLIPDATFTDLALAITRLHRKTTLDFALTVGEMVVDRIYGGNLQAWRDRGAKDGSLRRLSNEIKKLGNPSISPTSLQNAIATFDLEQRVGVSGRPQLTATHVRAVLGLPPAKQEALLGNAEAKDWTAARLRTEADKARKKLVKHPTGRRRMPAALKTIRRWHREMEDAASFADIDKLAELDEDERTTLKATLEALVTRWQSVLSTLG